MPDNLDIDVSLLEINLSLTPDERIVRHQSALDLMNLLQEAGKQLNEKPKQTS